MQTVLHKLFAFILCVVSTVALAGCTASVSSSDATLPVSLYFFHDTACASCDGTKEFFEIFEQALASEPQNDSYVLETHNIFETAGRAVYDRVLQENGLQATDAKPPVLIVNGFALSGLDTIRAKTREMFLSACESAAVPAQQRYLVEKTTPDALFDGMNPSADSSVAVYFYRITCDECNETKPILEALPSTVTIDGKKSEVVLYPLNTRTGSNSDRVRAMFAHYNVPEEDQMVPIIFLRDTYLAGYDQISKHLQQALQSGDGLKFVFPS